ncbi:MAG: protein translocase subunit SecF [Firmicutes bacterium]|nr:protein translocase subunit SecF [Bacillota bacterium]
MKKFFNKINPHNKEFRLIEHRRTLFLTPFIPILIAMVVMIIVGFTGRYPLNLGMDFVGGYSITVEHSQMTQGETDREKFNYIRSRIEGFEFEGTNYNISVRNNFLRQGEGDNASLRINFRPVAGFDDARMLQLNAALRDYLQRELFPTTFDGYVIQGDSVSATISSELIRNTIIAIIVISILLLIYIAWRFQFLQGVATIIGLLHDVIIVFAFMAITRMEIGATFIAVLLTVVGYSINDNIIVFDRVRENQKNLMLKDKSLAYITNLSIKETLTRTLVTTLTTIVSIAVLAIFGVPSVRIFVAPIIVGFAAGIFSTTFITPGIWVGLAETWAGYKKKKQNKGGQPISKKQKTAIAVSES